MDALLSLSRGIDRLTASIGRSVSWLILAAILVSAINATVRKLFDTSSNAWLELQWYLFGGAYLLAAAYTLQRNEHIRIDIVSNLLPKRVRDYIDLFGHFLMLMPFVILMIYESIPFVARSVAQGEHSPNAGGLLLWPAKALILAAFVLLFIQGISEIIKRIAIIRGLIEDPFAHTGHAPPVPVPTE
ncbi:TRAP transporter small permease subunit [Kaistia dalseonensis]|uniref:TRAP transporter small permease protein n=1 Tax=Kaistia dalseonensis TaxID=410840 RepID=A0ABU0HAZ9_9HYPH|nr:TRAP transporter small permease subunit [Kaistia dalseonensis]MCX5496860.1 TRAP transporter small permease subunit [Kaistia dalseonensis]MDQ0439486.1 TRAP-type mannitol/chloroaromatic compound transport system permease small subunit [Kaistia dalseonensis]